MEWRNDRQLRLCGHAAVCEVTVGWVGRAEVDACDDVEKGIWWCEHEVV